MFTLLELKELQRRLHIVAAARMTSLHAMSTALPFQYRHLLSLLHGETTITRAHIETLAKSFQIPIRFLYLHSISPREMSTLLRL